MKKGRLNRRLSIYRRASSDDGFSADPGLASKVAVRWAEKLDVRDGERFASAAVGQVIETRFGVRFDTVTSGLTSSDQVECEGTRYEVVGVKEIGGRHDGIEISTKAIRP